MTSTGTRTCTTPRDNDLGLRRIANAAGLSVSVLPNGCLFAIEHEQAGSRIMLNQVLGSPVGGGIARLCLRVGGSHTRVVEIVGPTARVRVGADADRIVWEGETDAMRHRVTLWLPPERSLWFWHVEVMTTPG